MNTKKNQFLVERLVAVGQKIVDRIEAKRAPSLEDEAFFKKCYNAVLDSAPNQEVRRYWMDLPEFIAEARKARDIFVLTRAQALSKREAEVKGRERSRRIKAEIADAKGATHMTPRDIAEIDAALLAERSAAVEA